MTTPTAGGGGDSLVVTYTYLADVGRSHSVVADAVDVARSQVVHALADATGAAGFPGLGTTIAAFADVANDHLVASIGDIGRVSKTIGCFSSTTSSTDGPLGGLLPDTGPPQPGTTAPAQGAPSDGPPLLLPPTGPVTTTH